MIKTFSHKGLEKFFDDYDKSGIQPKHAEKLELLLEQLNAANDVNDMRFPGSGLHKLEPKQKQSYKQIWAVTVIKNWRLTFRFDNGDAYDVDYKDYH